MSILSEPHFHSEVAAYDRLESIVWPNGPVCPHCGGVDRITAVGGKTARAGLKRCGDCKKQFRVTVGTVFESSHVPLHKWFQAAHLLASSKKGISAHQLHRTLKVTYKTAWFMEHRLCEAMRLITPGPMGGPGEVIEIDETASGRLEGHAKGRGWAHMRTVLTLVQRGGSARSYHVDSTSIAQLIPIIRANVSAETAVMTDSASWYKFMNRDGLFATHDRVDHASGEYVRYGSERLIHTNTVEGYYSIFKRGMKGVYQHCKERHLHRYLSEFDFRYSNRVALGVSDEMRTTRVLRGIVGKRLTYRVSRGVGVD